MAVSDNVDKGFGEIKDAIKGLGKQMSNTNKEVRLSDEELEKLESSIKSFNKTADNVDLRELKGQLDSIKNTVVSVNTAMDQLLNGSSKLAGSKGRGLLEILNSLKEFRIKDHHGKITNYGLKPITENVRKANEQLSETKTKLEDIYSQINKINTSGGFNVKVNNKGFTDMLKVFTEFQKSIENFSRRKGNKNKNFFDTLFDGTGVAKKVANSTKEAGKEANEEAVPAADTLAETISSKLETGIAEGIKKGIQEGIKGVGEVSTNDFEKLAQRTAAIAGLKGVKGGEYIKSLIRMANGQADPHYALDVEGRVKSQIERHKVTVKARSADKRAHDSALLQELSRLEPEEMKKAAREYTKGITAEAKLAQRQLEDYEKKQADAERRRKESRERYYRDLKRYEQELAEYQGRSLTKMDKTGLSLKYQIERFDELALKAENNKYEQGQLFKVLERITKLSREYAEETYKTAAGYDKIKESATKLHKSLQGMSTFFQRSSALVGSVGGIFSTARAQAKSLFGYMANGFRRVSYQFRSLFSSSLNDGIAQYKKLEQAQIGFESFFGEDRAASVMAKVREEALKTPIVDAGQLAEYVAQLAPVANGNASLSINAALGALKAIQYGGGDASEMEYVVKNIRDVIAKGKATAIDIRQFNRAMPAIVNALKKTGLSDFVEETGDATNLNITEENVGRILDMFAHLNTDPNSPLSKVSEKQLQTMEGMLAILKERKTSTVEAVMRDSGLFDLMKNGLKNFINEGGWKKMQDFFAKYLKKVVDWINNVDWVGIGNKVKDGGTKIFKTIREAGAELLGVAKSALGVDDADEAIDILVTFIQNFIRGLKDGASQVIQFVGWIKNFIGEDAASTLGGAIGWLVSPMSKVINTGLSLTRDFLNGISRGIGGADSVTSWAKNKKLRRIQEAAGKYADSITTQGIDGARLLYNSRNQPLQMYGNAVIQGGQVFKNGKLAAGGWDNMSKLQKARTVGYINYARGAFDKIGALATKLFKGIGAAFIASGVIDSISGVAKNMNVFGDKTEGLVNTFSVLSKTISGAVTGSLIGGATGGFIGAVGMAATALIGLYNDWKKNKLEDTKQEQQAVLTDSQNTLYNTLLQVMKERGISTNTNSAEGGYAAAKLKQYIAQFPDPGMIDYDKAISVYTNALRFDETKQGMYNYSNSDEFNKLGGRVLNLDKDTGYVDELYRIISYFRMNGDSYDYDNPTHKEVVEDWLNGNNVTDKQVDALSKKWGELDQNIGDKTTALGSKIDTNSGKMGELRSQIEINSQRLGELNYEIQKLNSGNWLTDFVKSLADYDTIAKKGTYVYGDKVYGIADVWRFNNNKIDELQHDGATPEEIAEANRLARLNAQIMMDYQNNPNFNAGSWFRYMAQDATYGDDFRNFMAANGIVGDVGNYMNNLADGYFKGEAAWLMNYIKLHPETGMSVPMNMEEQLLGLSGLSEEDKELIQDRSRQEAEASVVELYDLIRKGMRSGAAGAGSGGGGGGGGGWFHGGYITPIYRATGGGSRGVDTVPAYLQPGEFVVRKSSVARAGLSALMSLNRGDIASAVRSLGSNVSNRNYNNSHNWNSVINNNQRTSTNRISIINRNDHSRLSSYYGLANRIALA